MIYTGNAYGSDLDTVRELGMGIMIASSSSGFSPSKEWADLPCALDNGAYQCHRRGFPFMEKPFLLTLDAAYSAGLSLDFIVCPDAVGMGDHSLALSMEWRDG